MENQAFEYKDEDSKDYEHVVAVWKEISENRRHMNALYWQTNRFFTWLVVLGIGAAGVIVTSNVPASLKLTLAGLLLMISAALAFFASFSAKAHGNHVGWRSEAQRLAERTVLVHMKLPESDLQEWWEARGLGLKRTNQNGNNPEEGEAVPAVREKYPTFFSLGGGVLVAAAIACFISAVPCIANRMFPSSGKNSFSLILPADANTTPNPKTPRGLQLPQRQKKDKQEKEVKKGKVDKDEVEGKKD